MSCRTALDKEQLDDLRMSVTAIHYFASRPEIEVESENSLRGRLVAIRNECEVRIPDLKKVRGKEL